MFFVIHTWNRAVAGYALVAAGKKKRSACVHENGKESVCVKESV